MSVPSAELRAAGLRLGFSALGVAPAGPAETSGFYEAWLREGMHGEMAYLSRHAEAKRDPRALLPSARSAIAVALNYNRPNPPRAGFPRIARYALGRDYHKTLRAKLRALAGWIEERHPGSQARACVDSAPILEREFGRRAGLGFFGKNTCLIAPRTGSWFFLGVLLTSVEFEFDAPAAGGCGRCTACIDACPTGAIVEFEGRWSVDARACVSYLTIEKRAELSVKEANSLGDWSFGCDVCQEVCPFNAPRAGQPDRARETTEPDFLRVTAWPSLANLARIDRPEWDRLTAGSPVRRAGLEGLRRNARANLSNRVTGKRGGPTER